MSDTDHEKKFAKEWRDLVKRYFPDFISCKYEIEAPNYSFKGNGVKCEIKKLVDLN